LKFTVQYLAHSGFTVSAGRFLLVFDAAMGPEPRAALRRSAQPVVFVSHRHGDHFNRRIFAWRKMSPAIRYILSDDIPGQEDAVRLSPGQTWQWEDLTVRTAASTDEGVAFYVEAAGLRIFHAGDLNDWHWKDESTDAEVSAAHAAYMDILAGLKDRPVDVAFFPVDPRMGRDYDQGARIYCREVKPAHFFPMHFATAYHVPADFHLWARDACPGVTVHDILRQGQTFTIDQ